MHAHGIHAADVGRGVKVEFFWRDARPAVVSRLERAAQRLGGDALVVSDVAGLGEAVRALIALRREGAAAAVYLAVREPLEDLVAAIYGQLAGYAVAEQRWAAVEALGRDQVQVDGVALAEKAKPEAAVRRGAYAALRLADLVLVDGPEHARRVAALAGRGAARTVPILAAASAPPPLPKGRRVVVYAPDAPREALRAFDVLFARRELAWSAISRGDDPALPPDTAVAIVPDWSAPDAALALHERGVRVLAPFSSDAPALGYAFGYDPLKARTLYRALDRALSEDAIPQTNAAALDGLLEAQRAGRVAGPRLSVIVRTYDRPVLLRRALESLARQTYREVEAVVVNDAGPDVAALLAEFDGRLALRYVLRERNGGLVAAVNDGVRAATGTYVGYLDDDDVWYPDHAARTVDVLERTGARVVYVNCVAEYADVVEGELVPREYAIFTDKDFVKDAYLYDNLATVHSYVHRRELFERFGLFDEALGAADDWEMWLRMSREIDFVHLDRVTVEYSWRRDPASENMTFRKQRAFAHAHRYVAEKHRDAYAEWPSLLRGRFETADRFDAAAAAIEGEPALAEGLFRPPEPQL